MSTMIAAPWGAVKFSDDDSHASITVWFPVLEGETEQITLSKLLAVESFLIPLTSESLIHFVSDAPDKELTDGVCTLLAQMLTHFSHPDTITGHTASTALTTLFYRTSKDVHRLGWGTAADFTSFVRKIASIVQADQKEQNELALPTEAKSYIWVHKATGADIAPGGEMFYLRQHGSPFWASIDRSKSLMLSSKKITLWSPADVRVDPKAWKRA